MRRLAATSLVVLLGVACGGSQPSSAAQPSATPSVAASPSPSGQLPTSAPAATPVPQLDRCHTSGLTLTAAAPPQAAAGNLYQELGLTNHTGTSCWVYGYVGMALLDGTGKQLPTRVVRDTGNVFPFAHVGQYTVAAGATAPFWVHWEQVPTGQETSCPTAVGLLVTPPDETTQLRLNAVQITACNGGELDASPMMPPGTKGF